MPLSVAFSTSQALATPNSLSFLDGSTGTDVAVVARRIYLTDSNGDPVVTEGNANDYELWSNFPGTTTITLTDIITRDAGLFCRVDWVNSGGTVLYTTSAYIPCVMNMTVYYIFLIKCQSSNPNHIVRNNFYENMLKLLGCIKNATDSLTLITDIKSSQAACDRGFELINSPANFF